MEKAGRLNLTQLATLLEFGRQGTLAAAAEALGYTPGAVSQHLAVLGQTVGTPLVRKTGRTLVLTDAGTLLLRHADELLRSERSAMRAVASLRDDVAGELVVGTWGSTAATLMAPVVHRMAGEFPGVTVRSVELDLDDVATHVLHGRVDVAFGLDYSDAPLPRHAGLTMLGLQCEEFAIAMAREPAGPGGPMTAAELRELPWIMPPASSQYGSALRAGLRRRGIEPTVLHEVTDTAASQHLAAAGLGITVVTPLMRRLSPGVELQVRPMRDPLTRDVVLLVPSTHRQRPATVFADTARQVVDALPKA
jgi:DNA-binding transcriptional LysR family regulator